jgi:2-keto-3-deoxy-galactonokinase
MDDPAVTAKQVVDLAKKHIEDQQCRIVRQRELLAKYERDDDVARLSGARLVLERMQKQLAQMTAAHVAAEEHLSKLTLDEASVEKVVRDTQCSASSSRSRPTCCAMPAATRLPTKA